MKNINVFKRYELKYLLTRDQYREIKEFLAGRAQIDEYGRSSIRNLYYDTPDFLLARRSAEKPFYKEKLRLRSYGAAVPDGKVFLEIKKKYDSVVYKRRVVLPTAAADGKEAKDISMPETQIGKELAWFSEFYGSLAPKIFLSYEREAYYGIQNKDLRITFDGELLWREENLSLQSGAYGQYILPPDKIIMEIKTASAIPLWLAAYLSEQRIYKTSFSKYGTVYQQLLLHKNSKGDENCA